MYKTRVDKILFWKQHIFFKFIQYLSVYIYKGPYLST